MAQERTIGLQVNIQADRELVFQHLTQPALLQKWFCNKAELHPDDKGLFVFEGPHSFISSFPEKQGKGKIEKFESPSSFWFNFPINNQVTRICYCLEEIDQGTRLSLFHENIPDDCLIMDALVICLGNLKHVIETGSSVYLLDYEHDITEKTLNREICIPSPPDRIFKALTDIEDLKNWLSFSMKTVELKIGGKYDIGWRDKEGNLMGPVEIIELEQNKILAYSWAYDNDGGDKVRWELHENSEMTLVKLIHTGFKSGRYNKDYVQGWHAFLITLAEYLRMKKRFFTVLTGDWSM